MVKQLEETHEKLANQVENMFYEECQNVSMGKLFHLMVRGKKLDDEKETCEVIIELHKKNLHIEA
jgi:phosphoribosylformylglycinamidine (FGAM) synthase PurS component